MSNIEIKKLNEYAQEPTHGSEDAAGYDLHAAFGPEIAIAIEPHETKMIGTGLAFKIPKGTFLGIYPRSGLAVKQGLRLANCTGIIDADYRGEVKVAIHNDSNQTRVIENGERIAQAILQEYIPMNFTFVEELEETERGEGGFGSTGI